MEVARRLHVRRDPRRTCRVHDRVGGVGLFAVGCNDRIVGMLLEVIIRQVRVVGTRV